MSQALSATIVASHLERIRRISPLTHVITNDVVTGFIANVLLVLGADRILANACGAIVAITGEIDYITDGVRMVSVKAGDPC